MYTYNYESIYIVCVSIFSLFVIINSSIYIYTLYTYFCMYNTNVLFMYLIFDYNVYRK